MYQDVHDAATSSMIGKVGMFLLMITVTILFGALSLAFFWAPAAGKFEIPWLFYLNTLLLGASSFFLHRAWSNTDSARSRRWLMMAMGVGMVFLLGQGIAYLQLIDMGYLIQNSGSKMQYLYVLSGLHAAHLIGGLIFLGVVLWRFPQSKRRNFELALYFWHFLGILWVYLLFVLLLGV